MWCAHACHSVHGVDGGSEGNLQEPVLSSACATWDQMKVPRLGNRGLHSLSCHINPRYVIFKSSFNKKERMMKKILDSFCCCFVCWRQRLMYPRLELAVYLRPWASDTACLYLPNAQFLGMCTILVYAVLWIKHRASCMLVSSLADVLQAQRRAVFTSGKHKEDGSYTARV